MFKTGRVWPSTGTGVSRLVGAGSPPPAGLDTVAGFQDGLLHICRRTEQARGLLVTQTWLTGLLNYLVSTVCPGACSRDNKECLYFCTVRRLVCFKRLLVMLSHKKASRLDYLLMLS